MAIAIQSLSVTISTHCLTHLSAPPRLVATILHDLHPWSPSAERSDTQKPETRTICETNTNLEQQ